LLVLNSVHRLFLAVFLPALVLLPACSEERAYQREFATAVLGSGPLVDSVMATGRVHTIASVKVSSQLSGRIDEVYVDFNDSVAEGQPLARLDAQIFQSRVDELTAALALAEADLDSADAALEGAEAKFEEDRRDHARKENLSGKGSVSDSEVSRAQAIMRQSSSALKVRRAAARTRIANVAAAKASLNQAQIDLDRSLIKAPIAGIVISRTIEPGQTVAASLSAPDLFVIAKDLDRVEVHARIDEADIGKIAVGQAASFRIDAFPGKVFAGVVSQIRKSPEIFQNVVSYAVLIEADNPDQIMLPGMTALIEIVTARKDDVLQVPNAALRFRMPGQAASTRSGVVADYAGAGVWTVPADGVPRRVGLESGYSDGEYSEVLSGDVKVGDTVIIGYHN
jgi:HlyD family secretion protein